MTQRYFIPLLIAGTILFLIFLFFIISYIIIYTRRQQSNKLEKAQLIFDHQKNLLSARLDEQERAMTQISKEIHDNVAQKIDFIHMNVKAMHEGKSDQDNTKFINNSKTLLEQVTNDLRNISYSLNSDYIQARGLGEVLAKELDYIGASKNITCRLDIKGQYKTLKGEQELLMYRIAQEALHNAAKYSRASKIDIALSYDGDKITMSISDNGIGFDQSVPAKMNGLGFRNMKQRADLLNGDLQIVSKPGEGCSIRLAMAS